MSWHSPSLGADPESVCASAGVVPWNGIERLLQGATGIADDEARCLPPSRPVL